MNKYNITLIILVIVVVVTGIGVVLFTNQSSEPSQVVLVENESKETIQRDLDKEPEVITSEIDINDWQTYRNEELGFEFMYPNIWEIQFNENQLVLAIPNIDGLPLLDTLGSIVISTSEKEVNTLIEEGRGKLKSSWLKELGIDKEISEIKNELRDKTIVKLGPVKPPSAMNQESYIVVFNGETTLLITAIIKGGNSEETNQQIEEIYNSIIFL